MVPETLEEIRREILERSRSETDSAGRQVSVLREDQALQLAGLHGVDVQDVYREALETAVCPLRYLRNRESISPEEQLRLLNSQVAVIGAGGLGGHVIQSLARIGIGRVVVVDPDRFDETNLNRQAFSSRDTLGKGKAESAREAVAAINPAAHVKAVSERLNTSNASQLLQGSEVVVDALDNIPDRLALEDAAAALGIPLIHGAIAAFEGQLTTVYPGDEGLKRLYGTGSMRKDPRSPEALLGVPSITPAVVAALQTMEVVKILLHRGRTIRHRMIHLDLESARWDEFVLEENTP